MKNYDIRIDLLRVVSTFAVVWLHVSANVVVTSPDVYSSVWWVGNLSDALTRWCVPVFVMISGALLLSGDVDTEIGSFYRRGAKRLLPPLVFWTAFYMLLNQRVVHDTTASVIVKIATGMPYYHLWYLYMLVGLYLFTPFLRQIVIASSARTLLLFIVGAFAIATIETSLIHLTGAPFTTFLSSFLPYVAYFVAGHYLYVRVNGVSRKPYLLIAVLGGVLITYGTGALFTILGPMSWAVMYSFLNPIVIVMSLCVFRFGLGFQLDCWKAPMLLRRIAPLTLGIYLIHPFWLIVLGNFGLTGFFVHPIIGIPLTSLTVFGLSTASAGLLAAIPVLRTTVR